MTKTRDNHYVPQWYQRGFFDTNRSTLKYLDMRPEIHTLRDGREIAARSKFDAPTARCFFQTDLYSTFFGPYINDEIERRLFGSLDTKGSNAVRAFIGGDQAEWHKHFLDFFEYIDAQKTRTPKGLDWLRNHYPLLHQNDLMMEMQGIRRLHCTIWTEGVREIVSAEESSIKFLVSDHPVTIYNYAVPPEDDLCRYPNDPSVALKASQTLYPLNRDFCLILTNLEFAENSSLEDPRRKRSFARNYRNSWVKTDALIRSRRLSNEQVAEVNFILKARARRYIAAGREEWLYPESIVRDSWDSLRETLRPPTDELWHFGGEMYASFEDGSVRYQDKYGRTEKEREFLQKNVDEKKLGPNDLCGCGSGRQFRGCCKAKSLDLRPTWSELSIRERNIILLRALIDVLGINEGKDWEQARRDINDEDIERIYFLYDALWPLETDLLSLLPKPDGAFRAVFTGLIDPRAVMEFAVGASLYFGEIIMQNSFPHPGVFAKEYNPRENPKAFRQEFLKSAFLFLTLGPLVERGIINLIPDPIHFDAHLRGQMFHMANERSAGLQVDPDDDPRTKWFMRDDFRRSLWTLPREAQGNMIRQALPNLSDEDISNTLDFVATQRADDPLAVLQDDTFINEGGQLMLTQMAPNFEITLFLAQATGAAVITDSAYRWREIQAAQHQEWGLVTRLLPQLEGRIGAAEHLFLGDILSVEKLSASELFARYRALLRDVYRYLGRVGERGRKLNWEAQLPRRFVEVHARSQSVICNASKLALPGQIECVIPQGGIRHNHVNRMLLTSGADHYLDHVPMAFYLSRKDVEFYDTSPVWA